MTAPIEDDIRKSVILEPNITAARKSKRICLLGASLDNGNLGVQALAASLIGLINEADPEAQICLLYSGKLGQHTQHLEIAGRKACLSVLNYRKLRGRLGTNILWVLSLAFLQKILPLEAIRKRIIGSNVILNRLYHSDLIGDIRGGDSFSDIYGVRGFVETNVPLLIVVLLGKKYVLLPQTYGPFNSSMSRTIARFFLRRASRIYARDLISLGLLRQLMPSKSEEEIGSFCPDVAFSLASKVPAQLEIEPPLEPGEKQGLVGLNISGLLYNGGFAQNNMFGLRYDYKAFVERLALKLLENTNSHILLVPHTAGSAELWHVESDPFACHAVANSLPERYRNRVHVVTKNYDQSETKGIIGLCAFFVGSRMHACIAALSQGIPTVGVAYSRKFVGVFDSVGLGEMVLDGCVLDLDTTVTAILRLYMDRSKDQAKMATMIEAAKQQLRETFGRLIQGRNSTENVSGHAAQP